MPEELEDAYPWTSPRACSVRSRCGHAWAELVIERDAMASQLFAAGKPRMGGERFRTLTFHPGLLDEATGNLPWSTYETWYDVVRKCGSDKVLAFLAFGAAGDCATLLAERKATLDEVLDRYDYVLMLGPPAYAKEPHRRAASCSKWRGLRCTAWSSPGPGLLGLPQPPAGPSHAPVVLALGVEPLRLVEQIVGETPHAVDVRVVGARAVSSRRAGRARGGAPRCPGPSAARSSVEGSGVPVGIGEGDLRPERRDARRGLCRRSSRRARSGSRTRRRRAGSARISGVHSVSPET